jgi:hypothetical protein
MMKALVIAVAVLMISGVAGAYTEYQFTCFGHGNMPVESPVLYTGQIQSGALAPGTWTIHVPDAGWPSIADPGARWAYIWNTYYAPNYSPAPDYLWTATFDNCTFDLVHTGVGTLHGVGDITFQVLDDGNQILDPWECSDGVSGAIIIIHEGTGLYAELCGNGSYSGFYSRSCDLVPGQPDYMFDDVNFIMTLWLEECGMATEASTWGAVKALFR